MGRVRVKICGITTPEDARLVVEAGADAVGLVFADSPRQVTADQAARIVAVLPPWVTAVGVFVNATPEVIDATARQARLGAVQLHGDESADEVNRAAQRAKVIKAFRIGSAGDLAAVREMLGRCRPHACLVDARVEGRYGGTGEKAPWDLVAAAREALWPLILSGGLGPEDVADAIRTVRPFGVDTSSGVERSPGRKDPDLVRQFVEQALSVSVEYPQMGDTE